MQGLYVFNRVTFFVAALILLFACGNSGSGSSSTAAPEPATPPAVTPPPAPTARIRPYELGDVVTFAGTMSMTEGTESPVVSDATVRVEFMENTYSYQDKNVLAAQSTLTNTGTGEEAVRTIHFWQESSGALYSLTDEYGNTYINSATNETGLLAVPMPMISHAEEMLQFYTWYSGHTSGYITMGERAIRVAESETLSVPLGAFTARPVTRIDDYLYATAYDDHKRDERDVHETTWWMDAEKGVIKFHQIYRRYSSSGQLQATTDLIMEAKTTSFWPLP